MLGITKSLQNTSWKDYWHAEKPVAVSESLRIRLLSTQCFGTFLSIPVLKAEANLLSPLFLQSHCVSAVFVSVFSFITINSVLWQISSYLVHLVLPKHKFLPKTLILLWALFPPLHWQLSYFSVLVQTSEQTFRVHFSGKDKLVSLSQTWRYWKNTYSPHELLCYGSLGPRSW